MGAALHSCIIYMALEQESLNLVFLIIIIRFYVVNIAAGVGSEGDWEGAREGAAVAAAAGEPCLVVQPWWLEHLEAGAAAGGSHPSSLPGPAGWPLPEPDADGARTLRWIYGAVVNAAAAEVAALCMLLLAACACVL